MTNDLKMVPCPRCTPFREYHKQVGTSPRVEYALCKVCCQYSTNFTLPEHAAVMYVLAGGPPWSYTEGWSDNSEAAWRRGLEAAHAAVPPTKGADRDL